MKKFYLFVLSLCVCSCGKEYENYVLPDDVFEAAEVISPLYDSIMGKKSDVYVYADSLIISVNTEREAVERGYFLELYDVRNVDSAKDYFTYGGEDGKLLGATSHMHGDTLLIYDYIKNDLYTFGIRQLLDGNYSMCKKTNILTQYFIPYKDRLLCQNPYCFDIGVKKYANEGRRFIVSDTAFAYVEKKKYHYETVNVVRGTFVLNWEVGRIFYADAYRNLVEVYDAENLSMLSRSVGPEQRKPSYAEYAYGPDIVGLLFYGDIPETYTEVVATSRYIYAVYSGGVICDDDERLVFSSYILKFDWSGQYIDAFKVNIHIKTLSLSEDGQYFYAYGQSSSSEYELRKYKLP